MLTKINRENFSKLSSEEAFEQLGTSNKGLSTKEAKKRQINYGLNKLPEPHKRSLIVESLLHSVNALSGILLISSVVSALTGEMVNAIIIATIVIIGIILDYYQSHRALMNLENLRSKVAATSTVLRDEKWSEVLSKEIVPGDTIQLMAGDLVPADALLLTSKDLHLQQAALTGESLPVEKKVLQTNTPQTDSSNIVFSGSSVISGNATALVFETGANTLFGEIAKDIGATPPPTEFEMGINKFGLFIFKVVIFLILFIFLFSIYLKRNILESFLFSVALAVGLTPEFLPMITMVTLSTGAVRMFHKKVIVKTLASIQNLGSIDILCSDKTGTLTLGEMSLEKSLDILGNPSEKVILLAYLNSINQTGIKNPIDEAILRKTNVNPLDIAILKHAHPSVQSYNKVDEIPFDFERRRSSVVVDKGGEYILITKGEPEHIFNLCDKYEVSEKTISIDSVANEKFSSVFQEMSRQGYRLLAVAYRKVALQSAYHVEDEAELIFSGFLIFSDPVLPETSDVIKSLRQMGVQVKIITGDNELVAKHVCQSVGIDSNKIILGEEIEHMSDPALSKIAEEVMLFARITPNQKQRIISALRSLGHVVGFIGDGINDATSLRVADVGISVHNAVDIAKDSATVILLKRNLKVILFGILEGRKAFGNVMKYLMMGTSSNFGNMISMSAAIFFLPFLPMLPSQILLNNLLYDVSQVTIPTDRVDPQFMRKPRHWDISLIRRFMLYIGPISSIFDFITFYVMIKVFSASEALFHTGWFVESLATQTLVIFVIRTSKNPFKSRPSLPLFFSVCISVALGIFLPYSFIASYLGFVPLPFPYFVFLAVATLVYLLIVQFVKEKLMWRWIR